MPPSSRSLRAMALAAAWSAAPALGQSVVATVPVGSDPRAIAVDPSTNHIYVANESSDSVTVVDGATHATSTVPVGRRPQYMALNPTTAKVYVSSGADSTLAVIDPATPAVKTLAIGSNGPIAVNAPANKTDANNAVMSTSVDGVVQSRAITREQFSSPPSVCR